MKISKNGNANIIIWQFAKVKEGFLVRLKGTF